MTNLHRSRYALAGLLAAGLLIMTGASVLAQQGPGRPRGSTPPWVDPSNKPSFSHRPMPSRSPKATIDCTVLPSANPSASDNVKTAQGAGGRSDATWGWRMGPGWLKDLDPARLKLCRPATLTKGIDARIANLIGTLQDIRKVADGIAALDATQHATLATEIDSAIAELRALKARIDAETGGATAEQLKQLQSDSVLVRAIVLQVRLIKIDVDTLARVAVLETQVTDLTAKIAAAPSGVDTAALQKLLDDMKARLADARSLAGPLPAILLGLTEAQLKAGKADPTLAAAARATWKARFDIWKAGQDARLIISLLTKHS